MSVNGLSRLGKASFLAALVATGAGMADPVMAQPAPPGAAQGFRLGTIRVEGTQRVDPDTVISYMTLKPGDVFSAAAADQSLKALFATGLFADVTFRGEGSTLVVKIVENPVINRVVFEGNKKLEEKTLTGEVQLKPRTVLTRTKVQSDVKRLLDVYRRSGKFSAQVEPKIIQLPQNRVDLVFEIDEGDTTNIGRVTFIGNKEFSDSTLRGVVTTKESAWYRILSSSDTYDPERLAFDREMLRRHYLRNGYADFKVQAASAEYLREANQFLLTFTVDEGARYRNGKVDVTSKLRDLPGERLKPLLETREGDWYDADAIESTVKKLTAAVGELGYAFVEVEPRVDKDENGRTIAVTYEVREGPKVFIERIDIVGNERTLDKVVRREFRLVEGDAFNAAKLKRSEQRIKNLNFFRKVEVSNAPGTAPDKTVVQVKVEEQSTGELTLGGGFSSYDGLLGQFQIRERNLLGRGQDLRVAALLSFKRQEYDISFTEPYFLDTHVAAGFDIFRTTRDQQQYSSYDWKSTGFSLRGGYQISEHLRQTLRYTLRVDEVTDVEANASSYIREQQGRATTSAVSQDLIYDKLDSRTDPTEGYLLSLGTDLAGLGGTVSYIRGRAKASWFYPVAEGYVFALLGEVGMIEGLGNKDIRIVDRFFVGGDNLRGFRFGGAGPRDISTGDALGGKRQYLATIEQSFPSGLPEELGLTGRIFTDFGLSTGIDKTGVNVRDSGTIRISSGVGASWRSPFGPIRLDFGFPLVKESYDRTEVFRFSFGTRF